MRRRPAGGAAAAESARVHEHGGHSGADRKTVQAVLGHAQASHTLDIYADSIPGNVESAMDRLDAVVLGA